jgi:hypothetical protein
MDSKLCPHCKRELLGSHENFIGCCLLCRRFGLLSGTWPAPHEEKNMTITLTDSQIVRLLDLAAKIAALKSEMPSLPGGYERNEEARLELARGLRASLEASNDTLLELGALLRV